MPKGNTRFFLAALAVSLLLSGMAYYWLMLETLDMFGIDRLRDPEERDGKIFFTTLAVFTFTVLTAFLFFLRKRKSVAMGFSLPAILSLLLLVSVGPAYLLKSGYYETFDRSKWLNEKTDRIKMARLLVKSGELSGRTKQEVLQKLGPGRERAGELDYKIYEDYCSLWILFESGKVSNYGIWVDD